MLFHEKQRLPAWVKAFVAVPVLALGVLAVALWAAGTTTAALVFSALAVLALVAAVPNFVLTLVTTLEPDRLGLRIDPPGLPVPFLPPRAVDVPLGEIARCEARTYRTLRDREYWGRHFWGLGTGRGGAHRIYMMRAGPLAGAGVELELADGTKLLVGSTRAEELAAAIRSRT